MMRRRDGTVGPEGVRSQTKCRASRASELYAAHATSRIWHTVPMVGAWAYLMIRRLVANSGLSTAGEAIMLFVTHLALDRVTRAAARLSAEDPTEPLLLVRAITWNPMPWLVTAVMLLCAVLGRRSQMRCRWQSVEHGVVLRLLALSSIALLTWSSSLYPYNFLAGQWHAADRALVVGLAVASLVRPLFLVAFVAAVRVIACQFTLPFGTAAGQNIDAILIVALVAIASMYVVHTFTGTRSSASVVLLLASVLASHFFVPGRGKLATGWFDLDRIWNFPLSAYTAGWLGSTSGEWARSASALARSLSTPLRIGTLLVELGAIVAVVHYRLLRAWLPMAMAFHVIVLAFTGFWFLPWLVLETGLLVVASCPSLRSWLDQNANLARGLLAAAAVLSGARLFQPPTLTWLDGPVSYGYELEGTGTTRAAYHVPFSVAAPFEQELSLLALHLASTREATAAYGAVGTRAEYAALSAIGSWEELSHYEQALPPPSTTAGSAAEHFVVALLKHVNRDGPAPWFIRPPPTHFWSSRPAPTYAYQEPLTRLDVVRVSSLHLSDGQVFRRELVLRVEAGTDGDVQVTVRARPLGVGANERAP